MVRSQDDWRAVDWAKNQVERLDREMRELRSLLRQNVVEVEMGERLERELAGTDQAVATHNDRITRVERNIAELEECVGIDKEDEIPDGGLMGYMSRQGRRIREIEKRLQKNAGRRDAGEPIEVWTDRQLEKLASSVAGLQEADVRKGDRLAELEGKFSDHTNWASPDHPDHPDHPDDQARRISSLEQQVVSLSAALMAYGIPLHGSFKVAPVGKIADGPLKDQTVGYDDNLRLIAEDKIPQFGAPWADDEFSAPIGGGLPPEEMDRLRKATGDRITGARGMAREQYERGLSAGSAKALENAERRVRRYLTERGFSEETIDDLTQVTRGENSAL